MPFVCGFEICKSKAWFHSFSTSDALSAHLVLHQCQWGLKNDQKDYKPCGTTLRSDEEFSLHLSDHLKNDEVPFIDHGGKRHFCCPFVLCLSVPYAVRGTMKREHLKQHIVKHGYRPASECTPHPSFSQFSQFCQFSLNPPLSTIYPFLLKKTVISCGPEILKF